jgi:hypothetical protein
MRHVAIFAALLLSVSDCFATARIRSLEGVMQSCALASQREVARRHRLGAGNDSSSIIYSNPAWAVEADNLFDACVKR